MKQGSTNHSGLPLGTTPACPTKLPAFLINSRPFAEGWRNALQAFNGGEFFRRLGILCMLAALFIGMSAYALYLTQMLRVRWRRRRQAPNAKTPNDGPKSGNAVIADNAGN
jgi:hypothetical protein